MLAGSSAASGCLDGCFSGSAGGAGGAAAGAPGWAGGGGGLRCAGPGDGNNGRSLFADRLTVVVSDHHDDEFGFVGCDALARHLRPLDIAARVVADEAGIGAVLAHDADL